jgi:hypothetical protein|eukprot:Stramenopile-MAST_4_protein_2928
MVTVRAICARVLNVVTFLVVVVAGEEGRAWKSMVGDPGMKAYLPATAWCGWNFCNGAEQPKEYARLQFPSPRLADCALTLGGSNAISSFDNSLRTGTPIPGQNDTTDVDMYAREKELYLGSLCSRPFLPFASINYSHWSVMFKSGNFNVSVGVCPATLVDAGVGRKPAVNLKFNNLPMNQPMMVHRWTGKSQGWVGGFFAGTYDINVSWTPQEEEDVELALMEYTDACVQERLGNNLDRNFRRHSVPSPPAILQNSSILFTAWYQNCTGNSCNWVYFSGIKASKKYPWLMNYLRANDISGGYGGYPFNGSGMLNGPVSASPDKELRLQVHLKILNDGVKENLFYLPEMSGCWKLDGTLCDGDLMTDVTRYICFVIGPDVHRSCTPEDNSRCPPTHKKSDGTIVHRNDTKNFPYECYLQWCPPPNLPGVKDSCDPYSNPAPQELMQILPCSEWAEHGFPATAEEAWVGNARTWDLNVGALGAQVYFAGKNPGGGADGFTREWISFEIGPEMMYQPTTDALSMQTWEVSQWNVLQQASSA